MLRVKLRVCVSILLFVLVGDTLCTVVTKYCKLERSGPFLDLVAPKQAKKLNVYTNLWQSSESLAVAVISSVAAMCNYLLRRIVRVYVQARVCICCKKLPQMCFHTLKKKKHQPNQHASSC